MRILLMGLPFYRFLGSHNNTPRLGIGYLSAILRKYGYEVYQYNPDYGSSNDFGTQSDLFDRSSNFMDQVTNPYHRVYMEIFNMIENLQPDVVGLSVMAGTVIQSEIIAKICSDRGIRTIVGGPMVALALDKMLCFEGYSQLVPGEAETVIQRVIDHPKRRVVVGVPSNNINHIPFPDKHNFINDTSKMFYGSIITARGCPFKCKYCAHWLAGGEIRYRSSKNVVDEIDTMVRNHDQEHFRFFDDTFTMNKKRVYEICDLIKEREIDITFLCETRVDCLDEKVIDAMRDAGLTRVKLGIESGSEKILKIYKPGIIPDKTRNIVNLLKNREIDINLNWMFGFPEETNDDLRQSISLAEELDADWNTISSLSPYYGTDMFDLLGDEEKMNWKMFHHNMKVPALNHNLDPELIESFLSINDRKRWKG